MLAAANRVVVAAIFLVLLLCRGEQRQVRAQHDDLRAATLGADADVATGLVCVGVRLRKERVPAVRSWARENLYSAAGKNRTNLNIRPAHGRGRSNHLRPDHMVADLP